MMDLEKLVFVTSNEGKLREAEAVLGIRLESRDLDLEEPQSLDIHQIVRSRCDPTPPIEQQILYLFFFNHLFAVRFSARN